MEDKRTGPPMGGGQEETLDSGEEQRAITKNLETIDAIDTIDMIETIDAIETLGTRETEETQRDETQKDEMSRDMEDMEALECQRILKRRERMQEMRRRKRRQEVLRSWSLLIAGGMVAAVLAVWGLARLAAGSDGEEGKPPGGENLQESGYQPEEETGDLSAVGPGKGRQHVPPGKGNVLAGNLSGENPWEEQGEQPSEDTLPTAPFTFSPRVTDHTAGLPEEGRGVYSTSGILIDVEAEEVIAGREPFQRINPASMTKILTLLVAAEHVTDLQDTFTMTVEITDYSYIHDCSIAGFSVGDVVTVEELMYGTILPSGADAALALAEYVAGSQEAFVELMNQKLEQLGLSDSAHFTNCVGLYDEDHYCTVYDMALILKAASDNELCRKVLSARKYATSIATEQQPEGILLSNWFLRRIEDKDTHGEVLCAKTGYVDQSGSCAASLAADYQGREYLCVTAGSISSWACIYDHVEIYQAFLPDSQE